MKCVIIFVAHSSISTGFISQPLFSLFFPLTYILSCIYFSQSPWRLCFHGYRLRNRFVGSKGVCIIEGKIHLQAEPGHLSEPRAPCPPADPEPQWLLSQRLEEQQQPALLLQGYLWEGFLNFEFIVSMFLNNPVDLFVFYLLKNIYIFIPLKKM